jgi:hypothetical protein
LHHRAFGIIKHGFHFLNIENHFIHTSFGNKKNKTEKEGKDGGHKEARNEEIKCNITNLVTLTAVASIKMW